LAGYNAPKRVPVAVRGSTDAALWAVTPGMSIEPAGAPVTSPALARPRWRSLPGSLAAALLKGGVGQLHLVGIAEMALAAMNTPEGAAYGAPDLFTLGADALCAAWEGDPLDGRTAGQLAALHKARPFLPTPVFRVAELLATLDVPPPDAEVRQLVQLLQQRDAAACWTASAAPSRATPSGCVRPWWWA